MTGRPLRNRGDLAECGAYDEFTDAILCDSVSTVTAALQKENGFAGANPLTKPF